MPSAQARESALFALAVEKPLTERSAFLQAVCGKDNVLRQRLEALLAAHDQPDNLVPTQADAARLHEDASALQARPTIKLDLTDAPDEAVGQTLGRYKLLERVGEEHPHTINSVVLQARIYVQQQQFDKAELLTDQALNLNRHMSIENSPFLPQSLSKLGWAYLEHDHVAKADALCEAAEQALRRKPTANPLANHCILAELGAVRVKQEKYAEAETLLRESSLLMERHSPDAAFRYYVISLLGASLAGQKRYADAEPILLQGYQGLQQRQGSLPPYLNSTHRVTESLEWLVHLYEAWGKPIQAAEWRKKLTTFQQSAKAVEKKGAQP